MGLYKTGFYILLVAICIAAIAWGITLESDKIEKEKKEAYNMGANYGYEYAQNQTAKALVEMGASCNPITVNYTTGSAQFISTKCLKQQ